MVNIDGIHSPRFASAGIPSVSMGLLLNNNGTPVYDNFEAILDPDGIL
eukprot:CAMPEP_0168317266 /NCGR_PEP_ID=MMETSP0210-20121227/23465_1 /TAXON_ID=40633 /ORGANISM="Condylostoma magnum, Strain COL2" /LENGTH=47 /DNA_ID= /DNA_START= /DNA_END= /DNA_ORIENTATION=